MRQRLLAILLIPVILLCLSVSSFAEGKGEATQSWLTVANEIRINLEKALSSYEDDQPDKAKSYIIDAYFSVFEGKKLEHAIKEKVSPERAHEIESMFGDIRKAIKRKARLSEVASKIKELTEALDKEAKKLDEMGIVQELNGQ